YNLVYDASDRLVQAVPDSGPATTWTYDEVARTITASYDNGAYVDVMAYNADYLPLTESWTGSAAGVIDAAETYAWNGTQLDTTTYRSGSEAAPHQLDVIQVDTMRYSCAAARAAAGRTVHFKAPFRIGR